MLHSDSSIHVYTASTPISRSHHYLSHYLSTLIHLYVINIIIVTEQILNPWAPAGGSKGERSLPPGKLKKKKKKFEKKNVQTKFFNLQKAPIVCYAKKFPHKRPPCYALNFCLKRPPYVKL